MHLELGGFFIIIPERNYSLNDAITLIFKIRL